MKLRHLLGWILGIAILFPAAAQDSLSQANNLVPVMETAAGETNTIFLHNPDSVQTKGCSLIQNEVRGRKIMTKKNGYKMVTTYNDEIIEVKTRNHRVRRIKYYNDYEWLTYHMKDNGQFHYRYSYENGCKKVRVHRNKEGMVSVTNKTELDSKEVRENMAKAMKKSLQTCSIAE